MFLQVSRSKSHRANKVLYVNNFKMILSTGSSPWNHRQIVLWDPVWTFNLMSLYQNLLFPNGPTLFLCVCRRTYRNRCMRKI